MMMSDNRRWRPSRYAVPCRMIMTWVLCFVANPLLRAAAPAAGVAAPVVRFSYSPAKGLGPEHGICRRDPSDVIRVGDRCYVWYTRVVKRDTVPGRHGYPSGYQGTVWCAVSNDDGHQWQELGVAVPKGPRGAFDGTATFTPNILVYHDRYYLYYTAVGPRFDNGPYADRNRTSIGVAVADRPAGPWRKLAANPVLSSTTDPKRFDSYRVDDACLVVRHDQIWMYYKGRQWNNTPGQTKMGVAVATNPEGPFHRLNGGAFVQDSGHEVLVWPEDDAVVSLVSATGPHGRTLQRAADGIHFAVIAGLPRNYPRAPGLLRADLTELGARRRWPSWGISMVHTGDPYLERFQFVVNGPGETKRLATPPPGQ